jgi:tripartite-type tricarboxylate transporter receptor subunit TctC
MDAPLSRRSILSGVATGALCAGLGLAGSRRALAADFYQGKTLTMLVGFAPGGGVDSTARVVAKHLVRFIPGQPHVVVQNMEGAAGLISVSHLYRRVTADGLTIGTPGRSWFVEGVTNSSSVSFDPTKLAYIGSPGVPNSMMYVRAGAGIKSFDELKSSPKTLSFGALGGGTMTALVPTMLAANGAPVKAIIGYGSTARILLALEQGEVDGIFTVEDTFARRQDLLKSRTVIPILQNKATTAGIPLVRDVFPEGQIGLLNLVLSSENFGLPVVGPPGIPAERVEILRKAFLAMCADKEYQAEATRIDQPVGAPLDGAQLASMMNELAAAATPEIIAAYRRLVGSK